MPDSRIRELIDEYVTSYKVKYKVAPIITGKTAKLSQNLWKWADENKVASERLYAALWAFFSSDADWHNGHPFELFYTNINKFMLPPKKKEDAGMAKAKELAEKTKSDTEARFTVQNAPEHEIEAYLAKTYTRDSFGCESWLRKNKLMQGILTPDPDLKSYQLFLKENEIANKYFGKELLELCSKPLPVKDLRSEINRAKLIEKKS